MDIKSGNCYAPYTEKSPRPYVIRTDVIERFGNLRIPGYHGYPFRNFGKNKQRFIFLPDGQYIPSIFEFCFLEGFFFWAGLINAILSFKDEKKENSRSSALKRVAHIGIRQRGESIKLGNF